MKWQEAFSSYATNVAFSISVSKTQVRVLEAIGRDTWQGSTFHMFYASCIALERRGLVEYNHAERDNRNWAGWRYRLTPAGEHVLQLLAIAGAVDMPNEAGDA